MLFIQDFKKFFKLTEKIALIFVLYLLYTIIANINVPALNYTLPHFSALCHTLLYFTSLYLTFLAKDMIVPLSRQQILKGTVFKLLDRYISSSTFLNKTEQAKPRV